MKTYTTTLGEVIEYPEPPQRVAEFLQRVQVAAEDPRVSVDELIDLIYGPENPVLVQGKFKGRGAVTREVLANPLYSVLIDLLQHKRIALGKVTAQQLKDTFSIRVREAAEQLDITPGAVRQAVADGRLSARKDPDGTIWIDPRSVESYRSRVSRRGPSRGPALRVLMGNEPGKSFRVKALNLEVTGRSKEGDGRYVEGEVSTFERVAVALSGKTMNRVFILEPAAKTSRYEHGPFFVEGRFKIVEKFNSAEKAAEAFRKFEPR